MPIFHLGYGKEGIEFEFSQKNCPGVLEGKHNEKVASSAEIITAALADPVDSPVLSEIVDPGDKVCIVISDLTRSWQRMDQYLPYIVRELENGGISDRDIFFLTSTGSHRPHTREEHRKLLGDDLYERFRIIDHNCEDRSQLVFVGTTAYGTKVEVNRKALEADRLIITGAIVYHFMAGWGGGRKSIMPGICGYESIQNNHALALDPEPGMGRNLNCCTGNFTNNVLHLDMIEATEMVRPDFLFNVIMDEEGNIGRAVAGHWKTAHEAGAAMVDEIDGVAIDKKADLVVTTPGGYPKDINLYQSTKAIFNALEAVQPGGVIISLCRCNEGFGNSEVRDILLECKDSKERESCLRERFSIARYIGYVTGYVSENWHLVLVSEMESSDLESLGIRIFRTMEEALNYAEGILGEEFTSYVMPHGSSTLPRYVRKNR